MQLEALYIAGVKWVCHHGCTVTGTALIVKVGLFGVIFLFFSAVISKTQVFIAHAPEWLSGCSLCSIPKTSVLLSICVNYRC